MKIYLLIFIILSILNANAQDNTKNLQIINDSNKCLGTNLLKDNVLENYCYLARPKKLDILLKKKGIDFNKINSLKIPKGWGVSYYNFFVKNVIPSKLAFLRENGKNVWHIQSKNLMTVYSPLLLANCRYLLKIDTRGNSKGEIKSYLCRYTTSFKWAGKKSFPDIKINKLGSYYSYLDMSKNFDGGVKLALSIKGDMEISKLALYLVKNADDEFQSTIDGEVLEISKVPNVKKTNYPDCYYTAKLRVHNILSGKAVPQVIQLVIPAFYKYKLTALAGIKKSDKIKLRICPFEKISKKAQSIQQADDLALFEFEKYFVFASQTLKTFSPVLGIVNYSNGVKYESGFEKPINPPISPKAEKARKVAMAKDLKYINIKIKDISGKEEQINKSFNKSWAQTQKKYTAIP